MNDLANFNVLLADDETHIRLLLKTVLKSLKAEIVAEATTGQEAIDFYREKQPTLAMLDINMPVKTGQEALAEIISEFPEAQVIMMTSLSDSETVEECVELGATGYILKDTPVSEMKQLILEAVDADSESTNDTDV